MRPSRDAGAMAAAPGARSGSGGGPGPPDRGHRPRKERVTDAATHWIAQRTWLRAHLARTSKTPVRARRFLPPRGAVTAPTNHLTAAWTQARGRQEVR